MLMRKQMRLEYIIKNPYEICDTPFMLYLLASGNISDMELDNEWAIFYRVFHETTLETAYNKKYVDDEGRSQHPGVIYLESIYRVNEEIAYSMYRTNNEKFHVKSDELYEIIKKLAVDAPDLADSSDIEVVENSYALCSYWKTNSEKGAVEFYHNNIRDFFLCEKIFREINNIYKNNEEANEKIIIYLCDLLQYQTINDMVLKYMISRVKFNVMLIKLKNEQTGRDIDIKDMDDDKYDYPFREKTRNMFPVLIEKLLSDTKYLTNYPSDNPIQKIADIVSAIFSIYVYPCRELLQKNEYLLLWNNVNKVNSKPFFRNLISTGYFRTEYLGCTDLSFINLTGAHLDHVNLNNMNLEGAYLDNSTWIDVKLKGTSMKESHLNGAYFNSVHFNAVHLENAYLENAILINADLNGAHMQGARLTGADISSGNLIGTHLDNAHLENSILISANMNSAYLKGVHLNGADLRNTDMSDAHLENAHLENSTLIGVNFNRTHMECIHLNGADLRNADLRKANLTGADLRDARLEMTILPNGVRCTVQTKQVENMLKLNINELRI